MDAAWFEQAFVTVLEAASVDIEVAGFAAGM